MAYETKYVVFIPNATGDGEHITHEFDNIDDANGLANALNTARTANKAIMVDGKVLMPAALHDVMVREVIDFDAILKQAKEHNDAIKEERKQAAERQAETLRSQADSLTQNADALTQEQKDA
jgi:glycogen synthase